MAKKSNINDSKDRFSSPIGVTDLKLPKKKSGATGVTSAKRKTSKKK